MALWMDKLLDKTKKNLILQHDADDALLLSFIRAALDFAEKDQKKPTGKYTKTCGRPNMTEATEQAVIMLATHFYESRDGSTGGFFGDSPAAGRGVWDAVHRLLRTDKDWMV